jgi:serpin B
MFSTRSWTLLLLLGLACPTVRADEGERRSDVPRAKPALGDAALQAFSARNLAFAADLYRTLTADADNVCVSPTSIAQALGMLYGGARGQTAAELARALRFDDGIHAELNALGQALSGRGRGARAKDGQPFRLRVVNQTWGQRGFPLQPAYLDLLAAHYGSGLRELDFKADHEAGRATINGWVAEQTEDKIPELLTEGLITPATRLVLTNAVYFNAAWADQFEPRATRPGDFRLLSGETVQVPLMRQTETLPTARGEGWRVVELPYDGRELSMVVIVPDDMAAFEAELSGQRLEAVLSVQRSYKRLSLSFPGFEFRTSIDLKEKLEALGVRQAFTRDADFSGMTGGKDLFVSAVVHQTFVDVDEEGTEAAAATAVVMAPTGMPEPPTAFDVDRPFLFLVQDAATGAVVFLGRVADPRS